VDDAGRAWVAGGADTGLVRIDADGTLLREVPPEALGGTLRAVAIAPDGGVYVAGSSGVALVDESGAVQWTRVLGGTGSAIAIYEGDLYVTGETDTAG
jgi:hypothetical protein